MQYMFRALFCFAAVLLAHTAQADGLKVLWWQVGDFTASDPLANVPVELVNGGGMSNAKDLGVTHARIREVSTGDLVLMLDPETEDQFSLVAMEVPMTWQANVSTYASGSPEYAFVIELGNWDGSAWSTLAVSETVTYADLAANSHIDNVSGYNPNPITPWAPSSYVVPEPTSGMLVLVGAALLALRRRRGALRRG